MNAKLRSFMLALVILPCALLFAACGDQLDQSASINTGGNYVDSTLDDANTFIQSADTVSLLNGFRMDLSGSMEISSGAQYVKINYDYSFIVKNTVDEQSDQVTKMEMAMRMKSDVDSPDGKESGNITAYSMGDPSSGADVYIDIRTSEQNMKLKFTDGADSSMYMESFSNILESMNEFIPSDFSDTSWASSVVRKATSGTTVKYEITIPATSTDEPTAVCYYVFENNALQGLAITDFSLNLGGLIMNVDINICPFSGDIQYPNFDDYVDGTTVTVD